MQKDEKKAYREWRRTFVTLWLGCFMTGLGFSMTMPFLSLYIATLGHFSHWELNVYSGIAFAVTFLAQAIVSPYWGNLADRKGRKLMCLRASLVMTFTIFLTGLANSVWMIIALRLIQGAFSGYVNNATAFMAGETEHGRSGSVMANMMTASVTGNLIGPLIGGTLADLFGFRIPFFITGVMMGMVFLLTLFNTQEHFKANTAKVLKPMKDIFANLKNTNMIITMFCTTLMVQAALMSVAPIISLLVKDLMGNQGNVSFVSGVVAAMPGFGTLLIASRLGHQMDKTGPIKVLLAGLAFAGIIFIPMFFVTSPWPLAALRFLFGLANAAMLPAVQTILTISVPREAFGRIFSYNQSFQAAGGVIGPLLGSVVSGILGYQSVFLITACMLLFNFYLVFRIRKVSTE